MHLIVPETKKRREILMRVRWRRLQRGRRRAARIRRGIHQHTIFLLCQRVLYRTPARKIAALRVVVGYDERLDGGHPLFFIGGLVRNRFGSF